MTGTYERRCAILEALKKLRKKGPADRCMGICEGVKRQLAHEAEHSQWLADRYELLPRWPEFSGNVVYPVPHPRLDPISAFYSAFGKWSRFTRYGRARRCLLNYLIKHYEELTQVHPSLIPGEFVEISERKTR